LILYPFFPDYFPLSRSPLWRCSRSLERSSQTGSVRSGSQVERHPQRLEYARNLLRQHRWCPRFVLPHLPSFPSLSQHSTLPQTSQQIDLVSHSTYCGLLSCLLQHLQLGRSKVHRRRPERLLLHHLRRSLRCSLPVDVFVLYPSSFLLLFPALFLRNSS
jgi:hypothetical protein